MTTVNTISGSVYTTVNLGIAPYSTMVEITSSGSVDLSGTAGATGVYGSNSADELTVDSGGTVTGGPQGGTGVTFIYQAYGSTLYNFGSIIGGAGGNAGQGNGGNGVDLTHVATFVNEAGGYIRGGNAYAGENAGIGVYMTGSNANLPHNFGTIQGGSAGAGGTSGAGLELRNGAYLNNYKTIEGGNGAAGGTAGVGVDIAGASMTQQGVVFAGSGYGPGDAGAIGILLGSGADVGNSGAVYGGSGGAGNNGVGSGNGGTGASVANGATLFADNNKITGGNGGSYAGPPVTAGAIPETSTGGAGGTGVYLQSGGEFYNFSGTGYDGNTYRSVISGGAGGTGQLAGGRGGDGLVLAADASTTSLGVIKGGYGGVSSSGSSGVGGVGVYLGSGASFTNTAAGAQVIRGTTTFTSTDSAAVFGGDGGGGTTTGDGGANGGAGISMAAATVTNNGDVTGGTGGITSRFLMAGGFGFPIQSGNGGAGVYASSAGTLTNTGIIHGGIGGKGEQPPAGYTSPNKDLSVVSVLAGDGGIGVDLGSSGTTLTNSGLIVGGYSGMGMLDDGTTNYQNAGGVGTYLSAGNSTNTGTIKGGEGGVGGIGVRMKGGSLTSSGAGGVVGGTGVSNGGTGVALYNNSVFTNDGSGGITGGTAAGQASSIDTAPQGGIGVYLGAGTTLKSDVNITGGAAFQGGVGVFLQGGSTLMMSGGIVAGGTGTSANGDSVNFGSGSSTIIASDGTFSGTIGNFVGKDLIDLTQVALNSVQYSIYASGGSNFEDVVTPVDGTLVFKLVSGQPIAFKTDPGNTGTDIYIACFCRGTRIGTPCGERAVQELAIGDRVVVASGEAQLIRWIGRRTYRRSVAAGNRNVLPVLIRAGALGENLPRRDLRVSPEHAMLIDGMLISARNLVNGRSIVQETAPRDIEYFHLELDSHATIFAEGSLTETFVDDESREMFDNAAEFRRLYPHALTTRAQFCAPRVEDGWELEAVRHRLAHRAATDSPAAYPPRHNAPSLGMTL